MTSARRQYVGAKPVVFITGGVGPVEPGDEFDVPPGYLGAFDARPDIRVPRRKPAPPAENPGTAAPAN